MAGWIALVLHLVVILLVVELTRDSSFWNSVALQESSATSSGGGGGGRAVTMIPLQTPAPPPLLHAPPVARPLVPPPTVAPEKLAPPEKVPPPSDTLPQPPAAGATTGTGGGSGGVSGSGSGAGSGSGSGPGTGVSVGPPAPDSTKLLGRPPEPRQLILPPFDYPKIMHGRTVTVTFFVLEDGRVDHVALAPEIPDRGYGKKFEDAMEKYRFRPARSPAGLPVPGTLNVTISF